MLLRNKVLRPIVFVNKKIKKFPNFFKSLFLYKKTRKQTKMTKQDPQKGNRISTRLSLFRDYGLEPAGLPNNFNADFLIWWGILD